ncbi:MAG: helix-turn-helix domain-containing protein [Candidatus Eisenbacteria bacterium]|uniref:Helix-turn-helix domain-containing protein n=1 Tax=Eiseniibacteriota bacterium TaxID=2212470 RepID=A0A956NI26_UNCEI|nr:helix-turn-helix domain-containing protein [Candidatus Eisenbacteria bacterium]
MSDTPKMQDFEILGHVPQLKALANPTRLSILSLIGTEPMTAAMLAKELDIPTQQANYHLNVLCEEGLATEVRRGRKRWKEERFVGARARNYIVDPAIGCHDASASRAVRQSVEAAFVDWRRTQLLGIDLARIARRVVRENLCVREGQTVLVVLTPPALKLAGALQVEIRAVGALPRLHIWSRAVALHSLDNYTAEEFESYEFVEPHLQRDIDAAILLSSNMPEEGSEPTPQQREKFPLLLQSVSRWYGSLRERRIPLLELALPHRGEFEHGVATPEEAIDTFWTCLEADVDTLAKRIVTLHERFRGAREVRVTCPHGTDLTVHVDVEHAFLSDGVISEADIAAGHPFEALPAGVLSFLPIPGTATGRLFTKHVFAGGLPFQDVTLTLHEGRIEAIESPNEVSALVGRIETATGDAKELAEVGIGLNPGASESTGKPVLDACMDGAVTLTFGNNEQLGGKVQSTFTLILPARDRSLHVEGTCVVDSGTVADGGSPN